ncbi:MAG TPA: TolC family protein [Terriglobales bacterium]|nr:TolC family protein [Terriglobales bacterium]
MKALRALTRIVSPSSQLVCVLTLATGIAAGQMQTAPEASAEQKTPSSTQTVSLEELIREVQERNPEIAAAQEGYQAATHVAAQVSALPDTQVMVQHFGVGSPRPFAGYSNSDFAYIGLGASQEIPYPGKRKLRAQVANQEAEARRFQVDSSRRNVVDQLKAAYFHLAYLQETLGILERNDEVLRDVQKITESRYSVGQGNQQEVLKAQLQHTKILQEITMHHREVGQMQAQLKQFLNRPQDSPDIQTVPLALRPIPYTTSQLMELAKQQNPDIQAQQQMVKQSESQVELSRKEFKPDFNVGYMYQHTNGDTRDYYMATFGINLPNRGRRKAELAQAEASREQAKRMLEAEQQRRLAEVQDQFVVAQTSAEQLKIYKEGLIPQSEATFRSAQAAYQSGKQDFETMLNSFLDVLSMQVEYQRELADHETALARLEALTGVDVR